MKRERQYTDLERKRIEKLTAKKEMLKSQMADIQKEITKISKAEAVRYHQSKKTEV